MAHDKYIKTNCDITETLPDYGYTNIVVSE